MIFVICYFWKEMIALKTYNVKEIAELLKTNPETVRRWIRSGKLKSDIDSRKGGNIVTEQMLNTFLKTTPKYASVAAASLATPLGLGVVTATVIGGALTSQYIKAEQIKKAKIDSTEVVKLLQMDIKTRKESIKTKMATVEQLELEINEERQRIEDAKRLIEELNGMHEEKE